MDAAKLAAERLGGVTSVPNVQYVETSPPEIVEHTSLRINRPDWSHRVQIPVDVNRWSGIADQSFPLPDQTLRHVSATRSREVYKEWKTDRAWYEQESHTLYLEGHWVGHTFWVWSSEE